MVVAVGPMRLVASELLLANPAAPTTISVASPHAMRACVARLSGVKAGEKFAAVHPPTNALMTPDTNSTLHEAKRRPAQAMQIA